MEEDVKRKTRERTAHYVDHKPQNETTSHSVTMHNAREISRGPLFIDKNAEVVASDWPNEVVVLYNKQQQSTDTGLVQQLHRLDPEEKIFRKQFRISRRVLVELGPYAADIFWRRTLVDFEKLDPPLCYDTSADTIRYKMLQVISSWPCAKPDFDPSSANPNFTPKFVKLIQILESCAPYGEDFSGIVYVQCRTVATILAELLGMLQNGSSLLRPCTIDGSNPEEQEKTLHQFALGTYNLLISSKSDEDLDVPPALIVIRYDLFQGDISHAYIHARTRGRDGLLIHMVQTGNGTHRDILQQIPNKEILCWSESLRNPTHGLFPPFLSDVQDIYYPEDDNFDDSVDCIEDPTTSRRIYPENATTVIYRFASQLRSKGIKIDDNQTIFEFQKTDRSSINKSYAHQCTVLLPGIMSERFTGPETIFVSQARRQACFATCQILSNAGLLDHRLFPVLKKRSFSRINPTSIQPVGESPAKSSGNNRYYQKTPDFWKNSATNPTTTVYPTIFFTDFGVGEEKPHAPILLLTRQHLPALKDLKLFSNGMSFIFRTQKGLPLHLNQMQIRDLYSYTVRICRTIANKPLTCSLAEMFYFFAPVMPGWKPDQDSWRLCELSYALCWNSVSIGAHQWALPIIDATPEQTVHNLYDAVIQDRHVEFTRRYEVVAVRKDLNPLSKPADSIREANYPSLIDFVRKQSKTFAGLKNETQPIAEVSQVPQLVNHLNPTSRRVDKVPQNASVKYLIPELCLKLPIPASTLRTALMLPSIMHRIDELLLVKELNAALFNDLINEDLLHTAISSPSVGAESNYERLELFGDTFLKYLCSIYVFVRNPAETEGTLHMLRQNLVSNKSLLANSIYVGLPAYIQSKPLTARNWKAPNFHTGRLDSNEFELKGRGAEHTTTLISPSTQLIQQKAGSNSGVESNVENLDPANSSAETTMPIGSHNKLKKRLRPEMEEGTHWLGDKEIADVAESIIGAAYLSGGYETALTVTKALSIPIIGVERWSDFACEVIMPPPSASSKLRPGAIEAIEKIIGYKFSKPQLLTQAMTHTSVHGSDVTSYERLEFIGDAILEFLVVKYIFAKDQGLSPGILTLLKGAMVSNSALAALCVWSGLHEYILLESYGLSLAIREYVNELKVRQTNEYRAAEDEERPPGQYWLELEPPKALSDVVESIIGAISISENFGLVGAEALFNNVARPFLDKHITLKTLSHHPTKVLFELFQAQGCQQFEITREQSEALTYCCIVVHEVILASAEGKNAALAARRASLSAIDALEGDPMFISRTCTCRSLSSMKE